MKLGSIDSQFMWNPETTLDIKAGEGRRITLPARTIQNGCLQERAASSETLLADVMAVRKAIFDVKNHKGHVSVGTNGGWSRAFSTMPKSQVGKRFLLGGQYLIVALRNCLIKGSSAHL